LTQETGDTAVFPWMVAGDPGQVDLVYYKANSGIRGAEFWASSTASGSFGGGPNANFYVAYRDNPGDVSAPTPGVERPAAWTLSARL
jgi:hypothetical protein